MEQEGGGNEGKGFPERVSAKHQKFFWRVRRLRLRIFTFGFPRLRDSGTHLVPESGSPEARVLLALSQGALRQCCDARVSVGVRPRGLYPFLVGPPPWGYKGGAREPRLLV